MPAAAQARTVAEPKRLPLLSQPDNRDLTTNYDAQLINGYAEKDLTGQWQVFKRPGLSSQVYSAVSGNPGRGLWYWYGSAVAGSSGGHLTPGSPVAVAIAGTTVWTITPGGTVTNVGTVAGGARMWFAQVPNGAHNYLVFADGSSTGGGAYYLYNPGTWGGTLDFAQITDADYPGNSGGNGTVPLPGIVSLNGTMFVMDAYGNIWNSPNLGNPTSWSGTSSIQASNDGDGPIALARQLVYVVAFKQWTVNFFAYQNASGSPLAPVQGAQLFYGCLSADTLCEIDGLLIWVTSNKAVSPQVALMNNLQMKIVSTPAVERLLNNVTYTSSFTSMTFKLGGHRFYCLSLVALDKTLVYDIDQNLWYVWLSPAGGYWPWAFQCLDPAGPLLAMNFSTGQLANVNGDYVYPNDQGTWVPVDIYTPNYDAGIDRIKQLNFMRFNADQTNGSLLQVQYSDDDYQTWSNARTIDLSRVRPAADSWGSFYRRAWHLHHNCNTPLRLRSVDLQYDIGTF